MRQPLFRAAKLVVHERKLQPECDRFGVNPVAAANHWSHLVPARLFSDCATEVTKVFEEDLPRLAHLHGKGRVENVRRSEALVYPSRRWPN